MGLDHFAPPFPRLLPDREQRHPRARDLEHGLAEGGPERTAATGSSAFVICSVTGTSSAPLIPSTAANASGSPKTRSRMPSEAATRTPATIASGPRSAPQPSRATVVT